MSLLSRWRDDVSGCVGLAASQPHSRPSRARSAKRPRTRGCAAPREVDSRDIVKRAIAQEAMDCKAEAPKLLPRDSHLLGPSASGGVE